MKIRFRFPSDDEIHEFFERQKKGIFQAVKEAHIMACMEAVNRAKMTDTYKDQTNNLRSSIGYVLYYNGEIVSEYFEASGKGTGGAGDVKFTTSEGTKVNFTVKPKDYSGKEGIEKGRSLANDLAKEYQTEGFVSVIVAGMEYALYVEAMGYDVLTSSILDLPRNLNEYFEIIKEEYNKFFQPDPQA